MPGMYEGRDYDVAGFAVGAVPQPMWQLKAQRPSVGDVVLGLEGMGLGPGDWELLGLLGMDHTGLSGEAGEFFLDTHDNILI